MSTFFGLFTKQLRFFIEDLVLIFCFSRFIINVPEEERKDLVRICFQIELAHWFYLDFYCTDENPHLKSCGIREFARHLFQHIPFLKPHSDNIDAVLDQWREYKQSVPTFGAIVLNEDLTKVNQQHLKNNFFIFKMKEKTSFKIFLCCRYYWYKVTGQKTVGDFQKEKSMKTRILQDVL